MRQKAPALVVAAVLLATGCGGSDVPPPVAGSWTTTSVQVTLGGATEAATAGVVTDAFFSSTPVQPLLGRVFVPEEHGANGAAAVVLHHDVWMDRLGGDANVIGTDLVVDGVARTIVGVMPPGFDHPEGARLWLPQGGGD